jgi:hypothetical protein
MIELLQPTGTSLIAEDLMILTLARELTSSPALTWSKLEEQVQQDILNSWYEIACEI